VNWLVALETLKSSFSWSDEELYEHFLFDLHVRYTLGRHDFHIGDFDPRTRFYFRERLSRHHLEHGLNLIIPAFEDLTDHQLTALKVKTSTQLMGSAKSPAISRT
jgi:hypothetical protein